MAKVRNIAKSRKDHTCSKCGKLIPVGDPYLVCSPYMRPDIVRCIKCGLKHWEASSSDYILTIMPILEGWKETYALDGLGLSDLTSDLDTLKDDLVDRLYNIPDQLQEGSAGELLTARIEGLESAIDDLNSIDLESMHSDAVEDAKIELDMDDYEDESDDCELCDSYPEDFNDTVAEKLEDALSCAIEDALSNIEI